MKKILSILAIGFIVSCTAQDSKKTEKENPADMAENVSFYGDTISMEGAIPANSLMAQMKGKESVETKVEATINETCKVKGCWMTVDMGNGEEMRVRFKDYGFFVPTEGVQGKIVVMEGVAFTDTISVADLQHLAEDAGKTKEEIAAINQPEVGVNFEAHGVIIRD